MNQTATNERRETDRSQQRAAGDWMENCICPPANIFSTDQDYIVEMEMPGVRKDGLEINVDGTTLSVTGRSTAMEIPGDPIYCETSGGNFSRSFELSNDIDTSKIKAELKDGVLRLRLPKSERARARKIEIQG